MFIILDYFINKSARVLVPNITAITILYATSILPVRKLDSYLQIHDRVNTVVS